MLRIEPNAHGAYTVRQSLTRPVIYLDHWAVRLFSTAEPLLQRFVGALHNSGGTWLFSTANLFEFVAMEDIGQAQAAERLLQAALPALYVADTTADRGFLIEDGAPSHPDAPAPHWLLTDLGERARINGGVLTTRRFVQDALTHADQLRPLFEDMKATVAGAVMMQTRDPTAIANARRFRPEPGMTLRDALMREVIREPHLNHNYNFDENDAMDFIHAVPAVVVCDYVLLDSRWCHKMQSATRRLHAGGVTGTLAKCFSKAQVPDFLSELETCRPQLNADGTAVTV